MNQLESNGSNVVMSLCFLGEKDFHRFKNRGQTTGEYADYIEQFYGLQAIANTKGFKALVVVFSEASFNEYLKTLNGHVPVTLDEYCKARAAWADWYVTSDPKRFGV